MALAADARDLRTLLCNSKDVIAEYHALVLTHLPPTSKCIDAGLPIFKIFLRNLFVLGASLSYSKELRDIFTGLVEKVIEPAIFANLSYAELDDLLVAIATAFAQLTMVQPHHRRRYERSVGRIVHGIRLASLRLFASTLTKSQE